MTGENGEYNYSRAAHLYPPFSDIPSPAKNYKIAPALTTIKEAASYFNIGTKKMRRIAEDNLGNIAVYCGNRFLIIRPKFEDFILNSSEI